MSKLIYFIPGLGTDERLLSQINLPRYQVVALKWIPPLEDEDLAGYATRLAEQIGTSMPFALIGVSFGGMIAVEIAKIKPPEKLVLIASAKVREELPWYMKIFCQLPVQKLIPASLLVHMSLCLKTVVGIRKKWDMRLFKRMLKDLPAVMIKSHINMLVCWSNQKMPEKYLHIHGDEDHVIPLKNITNPYVIKGGTHFIVFNQGDLIGKIITDYLNQ